MHKELNDYKKLFHETTELSGLCKALSQIIAVEQSAERSHCLKVLLRTSIKQLVTNLHILSGDNSSKVKLDRILDLFKAQYGDHAKELGEIDSIQNEVDFISGMQITRKEWEKIRHNYSAHLNPKYTKEWELKVDEISSFLNSILKIITLLNSIPQTPKREPGTNFYAYTISGVPHNFEKSMYTTFVKFFNNEI